MKRILAFVPPLLAIAAMAMAQDISVSGAKTKEPVRLEENRQPLPGPTVTVTSPEQAELGTAGQNIDRLDPSLYPFEQRKTGVDILPTLARQPKEPPTEQQIILNFENTPIDEVIKNLCEILELNYVIEPGVQGMVTIRTLNKIPLSSATEILDQLLILNNLTRVKIGDYWRFLTVPNSMKQPMQVYKDRPLNEFAAQDRFQIQILSFKYISAQQAIEVVKPFLSPNSSVILLPRSNMAMLIERGVKLAEINTLLNALDVDTLDTMQIKLFEMTNSYASEVAAELTRIFTAMGYPAGAPGAGLVFMPLDRINSILMLNPFPNIYPTVLSWLEKLDMGSAETTEISTFMYHVQNGDSLSFANLLRQIYSLDPYDPTALTPPAGQEKGKPPVPAGGKVDATSSTIEGPLQIISHTETNTLIIRTARKNWPTIQETIEKLDKMPKQVLIEVLITELKLTDSLEFGLEWALKSGRGMAAQNFGGAGGASTVNANIANQTINPTGTLGQGLGFFTHPTSDIMGILRTLATQSKLEVRASPILLTSDNMPASIDITNEVPISTTTVTTGGNVTQNIQYRSVGIRLSVTPKINEHKFVTMLVDQEVSNIDDSRAAQFSNAVPLLRRQAKTTVVVKDQQTLIIGGMMDERQGKGQSGVPLLSKIPVLGWLFGYNTRTKDKTELLILLTPHVITTKEEADILTDDYKERLRDLQISMKAMKDASRPKGTPDETPKEKEIM